MTDYKNGFQSYLKQYNEIREMMEGPFQDIQKQQNQLKEIMSGPYQQIREQQEYLNKMLKSPLQEFEEQQKRIHSMITCPFRDIEEQQNRLTKMLEGPFKNIQEQTHRIQRMLHSPLPEIVERIDWNKLNEQFKEELKEKEEFMSKFETELWAIDEDLLEAIEEGKCEEQGIAEYIEHNLEEYISVFLKDASYSRYHLLMKQAVFAFKNEQYALASFPLFSMIEGIISNSFKDYEIDVKLKPHLKRKDNKLFTKLKDYFETQEEEIAFYEIFFRRLFNVFGLIFQPSWKIYPSLINRNWVMHGDYRYEEISKEDVLKLFQLAKATNVLQYLTFEKTSVKN